MEFATTIELTGAFGDDRIPAPGCGHPFVEVVADGAGGTGGGASDVEQTMAVVEGRLRRGRSCDQSLLLEDLGGGLAGHPAAGETAAVVVVAGSAIQKALAGRHPSRSCRRGSSTSQDYQAVASRMTTV
ncbi:hypothetical protein ACFL59_01085 [Planctomycetota bacterium]